MAHVSDSLSDSQSSELEAFLKSIERSFPVDAVFSDAASDPKAVDQACLSSEDLQTLVSLTVRVMTGQGSTLETLLSDLGRAEPYRSNWPAAEPLIRQAHKLLVSENA